MTRLCPVVVFTTGERSRAGMPAPDDARGGIGPVEPLDPPEVTAVDVAAGQVELSWTWADARAWERVTFHATASAWDAGAGRFLAGRPIGEEGLERAESYRGGDAVKGYLSYRAPAEGLYALRVEVLARNGPDRLVPGASGHETTCRAWQTEKVLVGPQVWTVIPLPGIRGRLLQDAAADRFLFFFELYRRPTLERDCDLSYLVGWPGAVLEHDCDWVTGERTLVLSNPTPGTPGAWRLTFAWSEEGDRFGEVVVRSELAGPAQ